MQKHTDLKIEQKPDGYFDFVIENGDFKLDDGFDSAIHVSLFTDARAPLERVEDPYKRRGFAGDLLFRSLGYSLGSLMWLYEQKRNTTEVRNLLRSDAQNALQWLIDDEIAKNVDVSVAKSSNGAEISVRITYLGNSIEDFNFRIWQKTGS